MPGFLGDSDGKESACNLGDLGSIPGGKIPCRRDWLPTPVFLPGEFHGQRSQEGYSPWGCKELDTTERLTLPCARHKASVVKMTGKAWPSTCLHHSGGSQWLRKGHFREW